MTPDRSAPLATIAECAHDRGMKVGIVSSVSIDHATPAAFYAHVPRRDMYEEVGNALLASGFDYFAGGSPRWNKRRTLTSAAEFELAAALRGYTFTDTRSELAAARGKVVATLNMLGEGGYTAGSSAMPYAIDRHTLDPENRLSLADFLRRGVELLDGPDGFLIMAEGGNIDWAAHSNDAPTLVREIQDFDAALTVALEFQAAHPDETLIVVTADHETGGLTLGRRDRNYDSDFDALTGADRSVEYTGVEYDTVEAADTSINRSAGIAWTTGAHTALPAVVMASGPGSARFAGFQDNTDIPRKIALAIGLQRLNN
jgi:alkaline phosphatase